MQTHCDASDPSDGSDDDAATDEPQFPSVPDELEYLVEPAVRYRKKCLNEDAVLWFLENAEDADFETLATLAERARLSGDYPRFQDWSSQVDGVVDRIVDERFPYTLELPEDRQRHYLQLINPNISRTRQDEMVRQLAEADDRSELAALRREMRARKVCEANDMVHHMDILFLFALADACNMAFESEGDRK